MSNGLVEVSGEVILAQKDGTQPGLGRDGIRQRNNDGKNKKNLHLAVQFETLTPNKVVLIIHNDVSAKQVC